MYTVGLNNNTDYGANRIRKGINTAQKAKTAIETMNSIAQTISALMA